MKKKVTKQEQLKHEKEYVEFLKKRINSENFKKNVSAEEFEKTKVKYEKAKLIVRLLES